jgi:hypothetical protein
VTFLVRPAACRQVVGQGPPEVEHRVASRPVALEHPVVVARGHRAEQVHLRLAARSAAAAVVVQAAAAAAQMRSMR